MIKNNQDKQRLFSTGNVAVMAVLTAIAYVLYMFVKFPLPFIFPYFLDFQISDLPALLGGFALGPLASVIIVVVKCLLKMPFTSTACVGELADVLVGIAFVLPATLVYRANKSKRNAIFGMIVATACATLVGVVANRLLLVPFFAKQMGDGNVQQGLQTLANSLSVLYDKINVDNFYSYYLWLGIAPFNMLRCLLSAVVSYFVYKPLSKTLHWEYKQSN